MKSDRPYDKTFIRRLNAILDHNLDNEHFGVSELAVAANISRSHLHRKVHAYNGNSTSQFIREYRLNKAKEMLQQNGQTVAEVSYSVGFSSPTYFNTCFKELYGFSPGEAKYQDKGIKSNGIQRNKVFLLSASFLTITLIVIGLIYWMPDKEVSSLVNDVVIAETSVAVLPIKNWSGDPELEYISDGMTDAIINRLTRIGSISRVTPYTTVAGYKNTTKSIPVISQELHVQNILQGNIQHSGNSIRISLQLIDGLSESHLWSHEYSKTWPSTEIFEIQSNVAENVANYLDVEITNEEYRAIKEFPTANEEAYNYWLKARYQVFKYTQQGMQNAIPLFEEAIRLDSSFVEPYVNLAQLYMIGGASWGLFSEREAWKKTKALLQRAKQLDSTHIEAAKTLNDGLYFYEWDFKTMEENYKTNSDNTFGYCLQTGRYEEALAWIEQMSLESCTRKYSSAQPCVLLNVSKAGVLHLLKQTEEGIEILKANENLYMDHFMFLRLASEVYFYMGEFERSYALSQKLLEKFPDRQPTIIWTIAACEFFKGNTDKALEYVSEMENLYKTGASGSPAWFTALYYASIEDHENAIEWLHKSYVRHEVEMIWLRTAPPLKTLRSDPRYLELYNKVGFPVPPLTE